jgi:hypothetical protein
MPGGNDISDVSALSGLTQLDSLALYDNHITDITALKGLTKLRFMRVGGQNVSRPKQTVKAGTDVKAKVSAKDINGATLPFNADLSGFTAKYDAASKTATWPSVTATGNRSVAMSAPVKLGKASDVFDVTFEQPVVVTTKATLADYDNEFAAVNHSGAKANLQKKSSSKKAAKKPTGAKKAGAVTSTKASSVVTASKLASTGSNVSVIASAVVFLTVMGVGSVIIRRRA